MNKKFLLILFVLLLLVGTGSAYIGVVHADESRVAFTLPWSVIGSGGMGGSGDDPFWG